MKRSLYAIAALAMLITAPGAWAMSAGTSMFAIEIGQGTADLTFPVASGVTPDYITAYQEPEINVQGEFWYLFSEDYAFNLSGGFGWFSEKEEPNDPAGDTEDTSSHTSFRVRLGGDRVGQVGDRFTLFLGPGVEFFSGKSKFEFEGGGGPSGEAESSNTTRIGLSGRIGGIMKLSESLGIVGRVGNTLGYATSTADNGDAKTTWWPSSLDAAWGLVFTFGGGGM